MGDEDLGDGRGQAAVALVSRVDAIFKIRRVDDGPALDEEEVLVALLDPGPDRLLHGLAQLGQGGPDPVGLVFGVGPGCRADDDDRCLGMSLPDDGEKTADLFCHQRRCMGNAAPVVEAEGDGDHLGRRLGQHQRRGRLPPGRPGVAKVADVEAELPTGHRGPGHGRGRGQPALGDGVAVGEPAGLEGGRDHRVLDAGHPGDQRDHSLGQIDGDGQVGPARHDELGHPLTHDRLHHGHPLTGPVGDEGTAGRLTPVAEGGPGRLVPDPDGPGISDQLEPDPDGQLGGGPDVGGQVVGAGGIGPGVGRVSDSGENAAAQKRLRLFRPDAHSDLRRSVDDETFGFAVPEASDHDRRVGFRAQSGPPARCLRNPPIGADRAPLKHSE